MCAPDDNDWEANRKIKEDYLDDCFRRNSHWPLSDDERRFIKDLLLLIGQYISFVLIEEEFNTITMARLLSLCPIRPNGVSPFFAFVEAAIENQGNELRPDEVSLLSFLLSKIRPRFRQENILLTAQTVLIDAMLNPECTEAVSNMLNLAIIRCNARGDQTMGLDIPLSDNSCLSYVYPEFTTRSEMLMKNRETKLGHDEMMDYAIGRWKDLPESLREKIKEYDFEICLSNELYGDTRDLKKMGSTHISDRKIRVWLERNRFSIDISFFHEMGHVADYVFGENGLHSKTVKSWEIIYNLEKDEYWRKNMEACGALEEFCDYAVSCASEYFACSFSDYIQTPTWLKEIAPNTYHYLDAMFNQEEH